MSSINDIAQTNSMFENLAMAAYRAMLEDPIVLRRLANMHDALLDESEVSDLLGVSIPTLAKMRKENRWQMVKLEGKWRMSRDQFREQRDRLIAIKKRGF